MKKRMTKTEKILIALVVLVVICVTTISANAKGGWGTRVRSNGSVSSRPESNPLSSYYAKLEMRNKTKNRVYRFYYRWNEHENWSVLTGPVSSGCSNTRKVKILGERVTIFLKAECISGGSGYVTTPFVVEVNTTNWWAITD